MYFLLQLEDFHSYVRLQEWVHSYCCLGCWSKHCSESQALLVWYETGKTCRVFVAKWRKQPLGCFIETKSSTNQTLQMNDAHCPKKICKRPTNQVYTYAQKITKIQILIIACNACKTIKSCGSWSDQHHHAGPNCPHLCIPLWSCGAHLTVKHIKI